MGGPRCLPAHLWRAQAAAAVAGSLAAIQPTPAQLGTCHAPRRPSLNSRPAHNQCLMFAHPACSAAGLLLRRSHPGKPQSAHPFRLLSPLGCPRATLFNVSNRKPHFGQTPHSHRRRCVTAFVYRDWLMRRWITTGLFAGEELQQQSKWAACARRPGASSGQRNGGSMGVRRRARSSV